MKNVRKASGISLLVIYILALVYILIVRKLIINEPFVSVYPIESIGNWINVIPFKSFFDYYTRYVNNSINVSIIINNIIGNILLFVPMGFILPSFERLKKFRYTAAVSMMICFILELVQLLLGRGFFDIDDFILRFIGTVIGYLLYGLVVFIVSAIINKCKAINA